MTTNNIRLMGMNGVLPKRSGASCNNTPITDENGIPILGSSFLLEVSARSLVIRLVWGCHIYSLEMTCRSLGELGRIAAVECHHPNRVKNAVDHGLRSLDEMLNF